MLHRRFDSTIRRHLAGRASLGLPSARMALASPVYVLTLDKWPYPMFPRDAAKMGYQNFKAFQKLHSLEICHHNDVSLPIFSSTSEVTFFLATMVLAIQRMLRLKNVHAITCQTGPCMVRRRQITFYLRLTWP
jgi:hypothetical protein